ncbi:hypothetical protein [Marinitoga lauensis]|uniref:hypothetical protein n=1 Tax=Marinitoga lauensis TaxID=2201189 RepID=UPI0014049576|nr:hypothetical protein [Marinitoga lauensis]
MGDCIHWQRLWGIGYNYAWASGNVVFKFYLGVHPIGVTLVTRTLNVYDQAFIK